MLALLSIGPSGYVVGAAPRVLQPRFETSVVCRMPWEPEEVPTTEEEPVAKEVKACTAHP